MIFTGLFGALFAIFAIWFAITQFLIPSFGNRQLFPAFRRKRAAILADIAKTREDDALAKLEDIASNLKKPKV